MSLLLPCVLLLLLLLPKLTINNLKNLSNTQYVPFLCKTQDTKRIKCGISTTTRKGPVQAHFPGM